MQRIGKEVGSYKTCLAADECAFPGFAGICSDVCDSMYDTALSFSKQR